MRLPPPPIADRAANEHQQSAHDAQNTQRHLARAACAGDLFASTHTRWMRLLQFQSLAEALQVEEEVLCGLISFLPILSQRLGDDAFELAPEFRMNSWRPVALPGRSEPRR